MKLVKANYQDTAMTFNEDGWFNATVAAERFGKRVDNWLRLGETQEYIEALGGILNPSDVRDSNTGKSRIWIKTKRGNNGGTWLHPDLAVVFARWLDIRFAIWCDREIRQIIRGSHPYFDHRKARSEAASSFKVMNEALRIVRESQDKQSAPHHYINEARLINFALIGKSAGIDRDSLSASDLALLAKIEIRNAVLIGQGFDYQTRKAALSVFAAEQRMPVIAVDQPKVLDHNVFTAQFPRHNLRPRCIISLGGTFAF